MAKSDMSGKFLSFIAWLTGVIVSLAVAFGMINGVLPISWLSASITALFGWIVVVTTLIGVILAIVKAFD